MKLYSVIYRIGGTRRFVWKRTNPKSRELADQERQEIERMGYKAMTVDHEQSMRIGLPETYE